LTVCGGDISLPSKNSIQTNYSGRFEILDFDIEKQFVNLIMRLKQQLKQGESLFIESSG
jgi:hypothetical protein